MKVFLAGAETYIGVLEKFKHEKPYVLTSFFYAKKDLEDMIPYFGDFLLDSGAFTFCGSGKFDERTFDAYIERYADFIKRNHVDKFFELDVDSITGYEKVVEYRERLQKLTNRQPIPVWHISRGKEEFIRHCDEFPYVALGGYVAAIKASDPRQKMYINSYPWFIAEAHKRGTKIHGLGYTSIDGLKKHHFDSVDSTRWNCTRFGRIEFFNGQTMIVRDWRKENKRLKSENSAKITELCFGEWLKFQKYADMHL